MHPTSSIIFFYYSHDIDLWLNWSDPSLITMLIYRWETWRDLHKEKESEIQTSNFDEISEISWSITSYGKVHGEKEFDFSIDDDIWRWYSTLELKNFKDATISISSSKYFSRRNYIYIYSYTKPIRGKRLTPLNTAWAQTTATIKEKIKISMIKNAGASIK
jgi:hypothetical protein